MDYGMAAVGTPNAPEAVRVLGTVLDALPDGPGAGVTLADRELRTSVEAALLVTAVNEKAAMATVRERARAWPVPLGDSPAERRLLSVASAYAALEGRPAREAASLARRALRVEEAAPAGWWVLGSSLVLGLADEADEALTGLERALATTRARSEPRLHIAALANRSLTLHGIGDVTAALDAARAAVEFAAQSERTAGTPMPHIALSTALLSQGRADEADAILDRIGGRGTDRHIWEWHHYLYAKGRARRELGDLEGALEVWRQCGRSLAEAGVTNPVLAPWWLPATTTLSRLGRGVEAAATIARAEESIRRWGTPRARGTGLLAAAMATGGRARLDLLSEALEVLADSPARLEHAKAAYQLGHELLSRDDAPAARRHLRLAIELATRCGYHALGAVARNLLVTAGGRMPQLAASPLDSLTESERRIAALAKRGVSNREIAEALFITPPHGGDAPHQRLPQARRPRPHRPARGARLPQDARPPTPPDGSRRDRTEPLGERAVEPQVTDERPPMRPPVDSGYELLERDEEQQLLRGLLRGLHAGRPALAEIHGAPGMGRSALLERAVHMAHEEGVHVATAQASQEETQLRYGVAAQLHAATGPLPGAEGLLRPARERDDLTAALCRAFLAAARERPLMLVVDDVQWADPPTPCAGCRRWPAGSPPHP
ncbi:hypothetical protein GCM10020000_08490 [Streptomyces olivoverticillatus]